MWTYKDPLKKHMADLIANTVAETIVRFLWDHKTENIPHLYFNFVNPQTQHTFEKAFIRWTNYDQEYLRHRDKLNEWGHKLIEEVGTQDSHYIEILNKIPPELNEKSSILLIGETGVGKSFLAGLLHKYSMRSSNPFVTQNCALVQREHLYTTLFGWKRGSFTDAKEDGEGLISRAEKGTLFLDEIGYLDVDVQKALLTFLDDGKYKRYGDTVERQSDARLIFGTNQDLLDLIKRGLFQSDLYERISHIEILIPPLRERKKDILIIAETIIEKLNAQNNFNLIINEDLKDKLLNSNWPGNIRQLKVYIEKMFNHCLYNKISIVPVEWFSDNPPRDLLYTTQDSLDILENTLTPILQKWDGGNGKLLQDVIEPILAKIYIDNLNLPKQSASKILGLDGSGGKKSTLNDRYKRYENCKKLFDNSQQ